MPRRSIPTRRSLRQAPGLSLVELLIALAITAVLLTATMVATDACFRAYAGAAEQFSTQAVTRMTTNRLLSMLRTSTAHGPLQPDPSCNPPATLSGNTITSPYLEMIDPFNRLVRIEYRPDRRELWMTRSNLDGSNAQSQPLLFGVTDARFYCLRRKNSAGLWILERATMDLTIQPDLDSTLPLEAGKSAPIRIIGSTKPRKLIDD